MAKCTNFYEAFKANMEALGLPAPASLFGTLQTATGTLTTILGTLKALGPEATVAELIGATTGLEMLAVVSACGGAFYAGAVVGSLIVATDASITCSNKVAATSFVRRWAARKGVSLPPDVYRAIQMHPEVLRPGLGARAFAFRTQVAGRAAA
ncbi:hypothetical protein WS62_13150 [Burkholderia sp. ABCPW 14]|uniref:Uncharacterized protein n=2 Tax=Burkholderia mayonis TaxID=1385591 RepID=A0A1B4FX07_9BURK|nr:hypothetical protein WS71_09815 [Burkholderia mayonis]KVD70121.1 hypothetical protein WS62_13150 [Burkholderia sp. ABCPW 14]KVE58381.1 hypothetical protein WS71_24830 [Burkholderia mayonis]